MATVIRTYEKKSYRDLVWKIRSTGYTHKEGKLLDIIEMLIKDVEELQKATKK